ncbi:MAG: hypothetical protein HY722_17135 [Planctomycetes bacterium]|nr:hypothetical protein [Planctomycetota bacterium]
MTIRARGVSQIKTLAAVRGTGVHSNERHVQQFQIASLELEKTRRTRERQAGLNRIASIDARLIEIDASIQTHQEALGVSRDGSDKPTTPEATLPEIKKRRALRYG